MSEAKKILKLQPELWELFIKKEEYEPEILDKYQRFPFYASKHKKIFNPEVSDFLCQKGFKVEYPEQRRFAVCLTHDIDVIHFPKIELAQRTLHYLRNKRFWKSLKMVAGNFYKRYNPIRNFKRTIDLEKRYGAKSTFFSLCLEKKDIDFSFRIERIKSEIKEIVEEGWELGLHGGHETYSSLERMKREKEKLEQIADVDVIGNRNHYLRFKVPTSWEILAEAGFRYDSSFGYPDCVGFRNGMCHPFKPFDLNKNNTVELLEIPLHVADFTLFEYMRLTVKDALKITTQLIEAVEKLNGVLTILWHNTYMGDEMFEFYEEILKCCHHKGAWLTSGGEISRWWQDNGFI